MEREEKTKTERDPDECRYGESGESEKERVKERELSE